MAIHDAHETPMVAELGLGLLPGTEANIILSKSTVSNPDLLYI